jgi:histidine triad (HIT) family protein
MRVMTERKPFDVAAYATRARSGPCFVCELVRGNPQFRHHVIFEDEFCIAVLNKYPTLRGYTLVCPKAHREDLANDLTSPEYLRLQAVVHRVAKALKRSVPCERVYVLSLGSQAANAHLHWHVAPLPPDLPLERQQYHALMMENGVLDISDGEMRTLAASIAAALAEIPG